MQKKFLMVLAFITFTILVFGCQNDMEIGEVSENDRIIEEKKDTQSVCIWDKASLREKPLKDGKWLSAMALGERVIWTGEEQIDATDKKRKYLNIRLSDGTEGWASEYVIAKDAIPSVIIKKASIYRRPDLITITDKEFKAMDFVAVLGSKNDWIEVTGEQNKIKGWIQAAFISPKDEDITVAILASKAYAEKDTEKMEKQIDFILNNPQFSNSVFISELAAKKELLKDEDSVDEPDSSSTSN